LGVIKLRHELQNQRGETVCVAELNAMLGTATNGAAS
jgi:acyl dehydratase